MAGCGDDLASAGDAGKYGSINLCETKDLAIVEEAN